MEDVSSFLRKSQIPTIRFMPAAPGSLVGACPRCHRPGKVGQFCYKCCTALGAYIGTCGECNVCGIIGSPCDQCGYEAYQDMAPMGTCKKCEDRGEQYERYTACNNNETMYE